MIDWLSYQESKICYCEVRISMSFYADTTACSFANKCCKPICNYFEFRLDHVCSVINSLFEIPSEKSASRLRNQIGRYFFENRHSLFYVS